MTTEDFEAGRDYQFRKSELSSTASKILSSPPIFFVPSYYMVLKTGINSLEEMKKKYYPNGDSQTDATLEAARQAIQQLEKTLSASEIAEMNKTLQELYSR